jgi:AcrR family transcriptional regulator
MVETKTGAVPRRMPPEERRRQLIEAAAVEAAAHGYAELSLDAVAGRARVTRNLLYHYFPGGRRELFMAALGHAVEELTAPWVTDPDLPLEKRLRLNFERLIQHAAEPSVAWLLFRQSRSLHDPEISAIADSRLEEVVRSISLNHLGTDDPPPLVRMALHGFLAYGEVALDEVRDRQLDHEGAMRVLAATLVATVQAAVEAGS